MIDGRAYRKKPVVITAIQYHPEDKNDLVALFPHVLFICDGALTIRSLEGDMTVSAGDYIIRGVKGEFYPCKPDIFEMSYEEVTE